MRGKIAVMIVIFGAAGALFGAGSVGKAQDVPPGCDQDDSCLPPECDQEGGCTDEGYRMWVEQRGETVWENIPNRMPVVGIDGSVVGWVKREMVYATPPLASTFLGEDGNLTSPVSTIVFGETYNEIVGVVDSTGYHEITP